MSAYFNFSVILLCVFRLSYNCSKILPEDFWWKLSDYTVKIKVLFLKSLVSGFHTHFFDSVSTPRWTDLLKNVCARIFRSFLKVLALSMKKVLYKKKNCKRFLIFWVHKQWNHRIPYALKPLCRGVDDQPSPIKALFCQCMFLNSDNSDVNIWDSKMRGCISSYFHIDSMNVCV